jgi:hypothetical protein
MQPRIFEKHNQMLTQAVVFSHTLHQVASIAFFVSVTCQEYFYTGTYVIKKKT